MARVVTVNDVLDGHVVLDIECLDRIYLNAYVPILQTSSQVVALLSGHLGFPFPSPGEASVGGAGENAGVAADGVDRGAGRVLRRVSLASRPWAQPASRAVVAPCGETAAT